ncbi:MAG: ferritin-like domain-containing protein [Pseudomonadota bacterium]
MATGRIADRDALMEALHGAARLEHALCASYLFAAFSLKRRPEEGGVDWAELKEVRDWTGALLLVARQEMEHLGIVGNLLISIGGTPDFSRHRFPWKPVLPTDLPEVTLAPFSLPAMNRFVAFERPDFVHLSEMLCRRVAGRSFEDGLAIVAAQLRADADWDVAEAWAHGPDGWAPVPGARCAPWGDATRFGPEVRARLGEAVVQPGFGERRPPFLTQAGGHVVAMAPIGPLGGAAQAAIVMGRTGAGGSHDSGLIQQMMVQTLANRPGWEPGGCAGEAPLAERLLAAPRAGAAAPGLGQNQDVPPATIGAFYRGILGGFERLGPSLFTGDPALEGLNPSFTLVRPDWFNMNFGPIKDIVGVRAAIDQIIEEGEGTAHGGGTAHADPAAEDASHYERFLTIRAALSAAQRPGFAPARDVIHDPDDQAVTAPATRELMALHDRIYALMLQMLTLYYAGIRDGPQGASPGHQALPHAFLPMMSMAIRTLGEVLTRCGIAEDRGGAARGPDRAGPPFAAPPPLTCAPASRAQMDAVMDELDALGAEAGRAPRARSGVRRIHRPRARPERSGLGSSRV